VLDREDIVPYLMGKGETVSCRPLIVDEFVKINDVQITGNKSFYVKGFLKIGKGDIFKPRSNSANTQERRTWRWLLDKKATKPKGCPEGNS
jgi:hypothetical protein